jgi:hypothetical protein
MGIDLVGNHGDARFAFGTWDGCLELAVAFGWQPAGTSAPPDHKGPWSGTYCGNDYQEVSDQDARAMAAALHLALAALPKQKFTAKQRKAWASAEIFSVFHLANYANDGGFLIG